jgi:hypothetical protein
MIEEEQDKALKEAYNLLEKHVMDNFKDVRKCYVFWQCFELMRKYYEHKPLY